MTLPVFTAGATLPATDLAEIVNHLQGASAKTDAWHFRVSSGNNYLITLSDAAGAQKFSIRDSAGVEQFSVDSDGTVTVTTLTPTALNLPTSASPSQTADGRVVWDSDDDRLTVGTGAATKVIGLSRGAGSDASATQELMYDTTAGVLKAWDGSASQQIGGAKTVKYKSGTQVFTTDTAFADITASSGNFAFSVAANGIYIARYSLPVSYGGTGGLKLQLTGPAAPTLVRADALYTSTMTQGADGGLDAETNINGYDEASATGFSSSIVAKDSNGTADANILSGRVVIDLLVVNGANAGTVTLQGAQNSSNSTTTFAAGCWMKAERIG